MTSVERVFREIQALEKGRRPRGLQKRVDALRAAHPNAHPAALAMAELYRGESSRVFPLLALAANEHAAFWMCLAFSCEVNQVGWADVADGVNAWVAFAAKHELSLTMTERNPLFTPAHQDAWWDALNAHVATPADDTLHIGSFAGGEALFARPDGQVWMVNVEPDELPCVCVLDDLGAAFEMLASALESGELRAEGEHRWRYRDQVFDDGDEGWRAGAD